MYKLLKWLGVAALVSVPLFLIVNKLRSEEEEFAIEDEFDIFGEE